MPHTVAVLRTGSMGDHLIALPIYRRLRELHPQDHLALICNIPAHGDRRLIGPEGLLPTGLFDEFHAYPVGSNWRAVWQTYRLLRRARIGTLYYLMPWRGRARLWRDQAFFRLANIRVVGLRTGPTLSTPKQNGVPPRYEHEAERLVRAIPALRGRLSTTPEYRSLGLTAEERSQASALLDKPPRCAVALSLGTKCDVNDWGFDRWSELVTRLAGIRKIDRLLLIGAPDDFAQSEALRKCWPRDSENFCGRLPVRLSAAVLAQAKLFIGHDSGPMHLAAAVGVAVVAVFSARNPPGVWFPLGERQRIHYRVIECMGCRRLRCDDKHKACIRGISVDEVFASCAEALLHC